MSVFRSLGIHEGIKGTGLEMNIQKVSIVVQVIIVRSNPHKWYQTNKIKWQKSLVIHATSPSAHIAVALSCMVQVPLMG